MVVKIDQSSEPQAIINQNAAASDVRQVRANVWQRFSLATSYVTALPIVLKGKALKTTSADMAGLSKYLPAVGILIGGLLTLLWFTLHLAHLKNLLVGFSISLAWLLITGGLHLDGLMDTSDGIFSHQNQKRMLEIMADSRVGNFGVIAGVNIMLLKTICLSALLPSLIIPVLVLVPAWARWCETYAIGRFPYLREEGKGKIWHDSTDYPKDLYIALLCPLCATAVFLLLGIWQAIIVASATIISGLVVAHWLAHKLGGHTGDTYGAVVELAESAALLSTILFFSAGFSAGG